MMPIADRVPISQIFAPLYIMGILPGEFIGGPVP
jgi:hypothetical protein